MFFQANFVLEACAPQVCLADALAPWDLAFDDNERIEVRIWDDSQKMGTNN